MFRQQFKDIAAYIVGKTVVKLHYRRWLDIYSLASIHEPERYLKSQRKAKIPTLTRWEVWRRDHFRCHYCHVNEGSLTLDHKVSEEDGGSMKADNLLTACSSCNQKKANKTYKEFIESQWLKNKRRHTKWKPIQGSSITSQAVTSKMIASQAITSGRIGEQSS